MPQLHAAPAASSSVLSPDHCLLRWHNYFHSLMRLSPSFPSLLTSTDLLIMPQHFKQLLNALTVFSSKAIFPIPSERDQGAEPFHAMALLLLNPSSVAVKQNPEHLHVRNLQLQNLLSDYRILSSFQYYLIPKTSSSDITESSKPSVPLFFPIAQRILTFFSSTSRADPQGQDIFSYLCFVRERDVNRLHSVYTKHQACHTLQFPIFATTT